MDNGQSVDLEIESADASAIAPSILGVKQFDTARPEARPSPGKSLTPRPRRLRDGARATMEMRETTRERSAEPDQWSLSLVILQALQTMGRGEGNTETERRPRERGPSGTSGCARRCSPGRRAGQNRANGPLELCARFPAHLSLPVARHHLLLGWQLLPIYDALRISFTDDKFLDQTAPNWIGLQNYRDVVHDPSSGRESSAPSSSP